MGRKNKKYDNEAKEEPFDIESSTDSTDVMNDFLEK